MKAWLKKVSSIQKQVLQRNVVATQIGETQYADLVPIMNNAIHNR